MTSHGVATDYVFSHEFWVSEDYLSIVSLGDKVRDLLDKDAYIQKGEQKYPIADFGAVVIWLIEQSKKGYSIQRYKGLGEMNPDQLAETTMNPETRRMLRVTIEDAVQADRIFTTLMGEDVEPRRAFIESNALYVSNLDI